MVPLRKQSKVTSISYKDGIVGSRGAHDTPGFWMAGFSRGRTEKGLCTVTSIISSKILLGDRHSLALPPSTYRIPEDDGGSVVTMEAQWGSGQEHEL